LQKILFQLTKLFENNNYFAVHEERIHMHFSFIFFHLAYFEEQNEQQFVKVLF